MTISTYLSEEHISTLEMFGDLNSVVNKMLDEWSNGNIIDITDKPDDNQVKKYRRNINVVNIDYLDLIKVFGIRSKRISLSRLIAWFVNNEIYNDLGWETKNDYKSFNDVKVNRVIDKVINNINDLYQLVGDEDILTIKNNIEYYRR